LLQGLTIFYLFGFSFSIVTRFEGSLIWVSPSNRKRKKALRRQEKDEGLAQRKKRKKKERRD